MKPRRKKTEAPAPAARDWRQPTTIRFGRERWQQLDDESQRLKGAATKTIVDTALEIYFSLPPERRTREASA